MVLRKAIETKIAPPYAYTFMDKIETSFLETKEMKSLVWFLYKDDVFLFWTHGQEKLDSFLEELNRYNSYLKFTYKSSKTSIPFLILKRVYLVGTFPLHIPFAHQIHRLTPVFTLHIASS